MSASRACGCIFADPWECARNRSVGARPPAPCSCVACHAGARPGARRYRLREFLRSPAELGLGDMSAVRSGGWRIGEGNDRIDFDRTVDVRLKLDDRVSPKVAELSALLAKLADVAGREAEAKREERRRRIVKCSAAGAVVGGGAAVCYVAGGLVALVAWLSAWPAAGIVAGGLWLYDLATEADS